MPPAKADWPTEVHRRDVLLTRLGADLQTAKADLLAEVRRREQAEQVTYEAVQARRVAQSEADRRVAAAEKDARAADAARVRAEAERDRAVEQLRRFKAKIARMAGADWGGEDGHD